MHPESSTPLPGVAPATLQSSPSCGRRQFLRGTVLDIDQGKWRCDGLTFAQGIAATYARPRQAHKAIGIDL